VIEAVVPQVVDMLKDRKPWVCDSAVTALGEISKQRKGFSHLQSGIPLDPFFQRNLSSQLKAWCRMLLICSRTKIHGFAVLL